MPHGAVLKAAHERLAHAEKIAGLHVHETHNRVAVDVGQRLQPVAQVAVRSARVHAQGRVVGGAQPGYLIGCRAGAVQHLEQLHVNGAVVFQYSGANRRVGGVNVHGGTEHHGAAGQVAGRYRPACGGVPQVGRYDALGYAHVAPVGEGSRPTGLVVPELLAEVGQLAQVPQQAGGRVPACHGLEVFGVFVVGQAEVEPRRAFGHVAGAQAVQQSVEERRSGRAFGRCNPHLWLHAGEAQAGVHGRPQAVQDHIAGLFGQAKRLVQGEFVHLHAVAGHLRDGQRAYEAAVGEPLFHAAVAQSWLQGQRCQPAVPQLLHVFLEVLFGVLAGLGQSSMKS